MTQAEALAALLAYHALSWLALILVRLDVRRKEERERERLDAAQNRLGPRR